MAFSLGMENQDKKTQILMIAVLALVIGGSLFMVIRQLVGGGKTRGNVAKPMYKCMIEECGAEFEFDFSKMDPSKGGGPMGMGPMGMGMGGAVDCSECGGERCAVSMTVCPACKKYFVSEFALAQYEAMLEGEMPDPRMMMAPMVCPHCGIDFQEWAREQRAKRKKK